FEYDFIENRRVASGDADIDANVDGFALQLLSILRYKVPGAGDRHKIDAGLDALYLDFRAQLAIPAAPPLGDPRPPTFDPIIVDSQISGPYVGVAPFLQGDFEIVQGVRLLPGVRL